MWKSAEIALANMGVPAATIAGLVEKRDVKALATIVEKATKGK
jgi:hypothetical protein